MNPTQPPNPERVLLGMLLSNPRRMAPVLGTVRPEDLAERKYRLLFEVLRDRDAAGLSFEMIPLLEDLKERGLLKHVGSFADLAAMEAEAPAFGGFEELARVVAERGVKRRTQVEIQATEQQLKDGTGTAAEVLADVQRRLSEIDSDRVPSDLVPMSVVIDATLDCLESMRNHPGGITGLPMGFPDLDRQLTGLHPGELIVVAARPGIGKTTFAVNAAVHAASREGKCVAFFSLEMPRDQLGMRALASEGRVNLKRMREGGLVEGDYGRINDAAARLHSAPLFIDDGSVLTPFDLRLRLRRLQARASAHPERSRGALGLVVVDYLQLMDGGTRFGSREQEVAFCSRSLKAISKEFAVPVLALAQLNRKVEERKGPPMLSDLRESGGLEQDADVVIFLHPDPVDEDEGAGMSPEHPAQGMKAIDFIIAKQRNGPTCTVPLWLRPEHTRFESRARSGETP